MPEEVAPEIIIEWREPHFDPRMVDALVAAESAFEAWLSLCDEAAGAAAPAELACGLSGARLACA